MNLRHRLQTAFINWNQPLPLPIKLTKFVRNQGRKLLKRQTCCGHPGEPGC